MSWTRMKFTKMHGLGNDFIVIENQNHETFQKKAVQLCDRSFGIGADGILLIEPSNVADSKMVLFNSDGSEAEMCGNGIRCMARYLMDNGAHSPIKIETKAGIMIVEEKPNGYKVDMGIPKINPKNEKVNGYTAALVDMGNPHCVIFIDNFDFDWKSVGKSIEQNSIFPKRTNVEFVKIISRNKIDVKVWERGAGATLACGTGACASVAASFAQGLTDKSVEVQLPGGILSIELGGNRVFMLGPAEYVFTGEISI